MYSAVVESITNERQLLRLLCDDDEQLGGLIATYTHDDFTRRCRNSQDNMFAFWTPSLYLYYDQKHLPRAPPPPIYSDKRDTNRQ